jgi:kynureninase
MTSLLMAPKLRRARTVCRSVASRRKSGAESTASTSSIRSKATDTSAKTMGLMTREEVVESDASVEDDHSSQRTSSVDRAWIECKCAWRDWPFLLHNRRCPLVAHLAGETR